jgi:hypothetical protein
LAVLTAEPVGRAATTAGSRAAVVLVGSGCLIRLHRRLQATGSTVAGSCAEGPDCLPLVRRKLRAIGQDYQQHMMQLQHSYLPGGRTREEVQLQHEASLYLLK